MGKTEEGNKMEMETSETLRLSPDKESIKLFKNTKNYNWELKLIGTIDDKLLDRLEKINADMEKRYGGSVED